MDRTLATIGVATAFVIGLGCMAPQTGQNNTAGEFPVIANYDQPSERMGFNSRPRRIEFNGRTLDKRELGVLAQLEYAGGFQLPDGGYWYDARSGAAGAVGGPALGLLPPNLRLGGPMQANCSGGGTGVFVNGRELHQLDVAALQGLVGPFPTGRYWVDAQGNVGQEGGPALLNLAVAAQSARNANGGGS